VSGGSFVSPATRQRVRGWAVPIATALGRLGLTPNALTVIGFIGTCGAAVAAAAQQWILAGVLVLVFGIFDLFDGALARATGRASKFGAFLDSTLDRTGENLVYAGIAVGAAAAQFPMGVILAVLSLSFASTVTYTRARAESLGLHGEVGFAPREVRLVVLAAGLVLAGLPGGVLGFGQAWLALALLIIASLSAVTVGQRILHVQQQLDQSTHPH
jgi:CDP-diacylglycerol--glycerol-3-phosphate 3-phosphatidyltransferase